MSTLVETNHTQLLPVLEEVRVSCQVQRCPWAADDPVSLERRIVTIRSSETCKVVDKDKIERLVGELPRYTKIVMLFKRISDECMIPKTSGNAGPAIALLDFQAVTPGFSVAYRFGGLRPPQTGA